MNTCIPRVIWCGCGKEVLFFVRYIEDDGPKTLSSLLLGYYCMTITKVIYLFITYFSLFLFFMFEI